MFRSFMQVALDEARSAAARGEVPVGAAVTRGGRVLARAGNAMRAEADPTAHAEMRAIRAACAALGRERLLGTTLWVTLEPCAMCAGAIAAARVGRVVIGAADPKSGGVLHGARVLDRAQAHHRPEIVDGICAEEAAALLRDFFAERRGP
jgi:tRNA(Arg) A34 adenosine deaminase TadA